MQALYKKRALALVSSVSLIAVLMFLLWKTSSLDGGVYFCFAIPVLFAVPIIVGATVGAWVRPGGRPWVRANWIAVLIWWLTLLTIFIGFWVMTSNDIASTPDPGTGPIGPAGAAGFGLDVLLLAGFVYAVGAIPLIFLGTAMTSPR